jgi:hypothetical protein
MKARIAQLIAQAQAPPSVENLREDLAGRIFEDIQARRLYTYKEAAALIGCDPETIRVHARGFPIIKRTKPHKIPACVLGLIVKTRLLAA